MKRFYLLLVLCVLVCTTLKAQWTSEGTGRTYTLQQLAEIPETGVHSYDASHPDYGYRIDSSLKIIGDTILLYYDLDIADNISIEVENGGIFCENINFGLQFPSCSYAIRINDNTKASIKNCTLEHCGGISLVGASADFENVTFSDFTTDYYSSVISLMNATANISHCEFLYNQGSAISSAANGNSTIKMDHCNVIGNGTENANRPQINLGPGRADTILIAYCNIFGESNNNNVGGISIANLTGNAQTTNIVIDSCEIMYNRYGINLQGYNINALITNNSISCNDLETNPMNGGSGISIYGVDENCKAKLRNNVISGNLWGITSINKNHIDLGTADDWGENRIYNNGNSGIEYALYNNASTDITAIGNFWGTADLTVVEDLIFHRPDLGQSYGLVTYEPIMTPHPQLISLSCLAMDNDFLDDDITGIVNEAQLTVFLHYDGALSDHEEFHNLVLRYKLGDFCSGSPESETLFHFDDLYQSQLTVSTPLGESETWTIQLTGTESIAEQETLKLKVAPVPAHDKVWIEMDAVSHFIVTDLTGRTVCEGKASNNKTELDIQNWESGIYIINAIKNGKQKADRIVVY